MCSGNQLQCTEPVRNASLSLYLDGCGGIAHSDSPWDGLRSSHRPSVAVRCRKKKFSCGPQYITSAENLLCGPGPRRHIPRPGPAFRGLPSILF